MRSLLPLIPLMLAAGILLAGNGLQGTLIALRGAAEGFAPEMIGFAGAAYFIGFMLSSIYTPKLLRLVGHIRVFAALAAIAAATTLLLVLIIEPYMWIFLRLISGVCFAGLFLTVESWLNAAAHNANRGKILSIYRLVDLTFVTGSQFLLPIFGISGFEIFAIAALIICISMVPVSLADRSNPKAPDEVEFDLAKVWLISPLACLGCIAIGMTNSAFRLVGPLYAQDAGLSTAGVASFMSAGIIGGAVLQFPLGWMSDRFDRRWILLLATAGSALAGFFLSNVAGHNEQLMLWGIFSFGAFSLPLYSLSAAHANDRAKSGQYVLISAGLSFFYAIGASIGPIAGSYVINYFGSNAFFAYTSTVHVALIILTLWRMKALASPQPADRKRYVALLRTSPLFNRFAKPPKIDRNKGK